MQAESMNPLSISTLATAFSAVGVLVGVPSVTVLVLYVVHLVRRAIGSRESSGSSFGDNPDAILLLLKGITETVGALARLANWLGQFLFHALALVAVVGLVLGVVCWFTGRGLNANAGWARVSGFLLMVLALLPALLLALSFHHLGRVLMLAVVALLLLGLHALWMGYPPQTH